MQDLVGELHCSRNASNLLAHVGGLVDLSKAVCIDGASFPHAKYHESCDNVSTPRL